MSEGLKRELERLGSIVQTTVGCSMDPLLSSRQSLVRIEWVGTPEARDALKRYDIVLFVRPDGKNVLHRILHVHDDHFIICGDNQWRCEHVKKEQVIGRVTDYQRAGSEKWKSVSSLSQTAYAHLWCDLFPARATALRGRWLAGAVARRAHRVARAANRVVHRNESAAQRAERANRAFREDRTSRANRAAQRVKRWRS